MRQRLVVPAERLEHPVQVQVRERLLPGHRLLLEDPQGGGEQAERLPGRAERPSRAGQAAQDVRHPDDVAALPGGRQRGAHDVLPVLEVPGPLQVLLHRDGELPGRGAVTGVGRETHRLRQGLPLVGEPGDRLLVGPGPLRPDARQQRRRRDRYPGRGQDLLRLQTAVQVVPQQPIRRGAAFARFPGTAEELIRVRLHQHM